MLDDEVQILKAKIAELENQNLGLRNELRHCYEQYVPKVSESFSHIRCFVAMPFHKSYDPLLMAIIGVLEDEPYGWEVIRADNCHIDTTIFDNVKGLIESSDCYVVEISHANPNVMLELGQIFNYKERPRILLCRNDISREELPADVRGQLYFSYAQWNNENPDIDCLISELKSQFNVKSQLADYRNKLKKQIYLSSNLLYRKHNCDKDLVAKLAKRFKAVEIFIQKHTLEIATDLSEKARMTQILEIQAFLRENFNL